MKTHCAFGVEATDYILGTQCPKFGSWRYVEDIGAHMRYFWPLPCTKSGHIGILIILDHFPKFTIFKPLKKFVTKPMVKD